MRARRLVRARRLTRDPIVETLYKHLVCDWRQSRTAHMAARSRAYQDWCAANGQEPGYLYGSQQARIGRAPRQSDFNHKWNR